MQLKLALLAVFMIFTLSSYPAFAADGYYFTKSWGGQGLVKTGAFTYPQYVAVDAAGNVYVTDLGNARVQKFDNDGTFLHSWGSKGTRPSEFHAPAGIAVGGGYVYVVDHELNSVKKFNTNGNFVTAWGSQGSGNDQLRLPNGIALSKDNFVYVVDTGNSRVQKFDVDGKYVATIGSSGTDSGKFLTPLGIAVDSDGNVYVSDSGNKRVQKFTPDGSFVQSYTSTSGGLRASPDGIKIDSDGNLVVADSDNNRIVIIGKDGSTKAAFGTTGTKDGQFKMVKDVAVGPDGALFAVDSSNHRIQKFSAGSQPQTAQTTTTQTTQTLLKTGTDLKKPTIVPPKDLYVEATGGLTPVSIGQAIANDESGIQSLTNNAPSQFPLGITTVIWTAIDNAGNMGIATQTVTVGDSTPPVISGLSDVTKESQGSQNTADLGNPTVTDLVGVMTIENDAPEYFPLGQTLVTWTATDVAKNTATYTQSVTIVDTKPPRISAPAGLVLEASSLDKNEVSLGEPTVTDNSDVSSVTNNAPQFFPVGETVVTWTAVDIAGNVADSTQKVTIVDTTAPLVQQPEEITIEASSVSENLVELSQPVVEDIQQVSITNNAPSSFPIGKTVVTWIATDSSGNNSTTTQTVSVVDTTAPTITAPAGIVQEATSAEGNVVSLGEPTVQDVSKISSVTNNAPQDYPLGMTIVTWTATDEFGNSSSANQTVSIIDTTAPTITAPADVVVEAASMSENTATLGEPKISDLVGIESVTNDAAGFFPLGQTTITWSATDASGNTATAFQVVTVVDTTAPQLTVPADVVVEADGPSGTIATIGNADATDAIGVDSVTNDAPDTFGLGLTQVTWTATDSSGNVATAVQNVTVRDTTAPTIVPQDDITAEATSADKNSITLIEPDTTDSVSEVTLTSDAPDLFPLGETTVTWTATDASGNSATATQKVTVVDTTAPTITAPADIMVEATSKSENLVTSDVAVASDNVEITSVTSDAPELFPLGETTVTWTATDASGNSATATQKVTVVDTTAPTISISNINLEATSENQNAVDLGSVKASDNVEIVSVTNDAPDVFALGVSIVTWTATDASGNSATATQTVTIQDTTAPTITAPADIMVEATSASDNTIELNMPAATDSVSEVTLTSDAPELFPLGETTVTWTATDASGNSATATQKVTVVDTTAPTITAPADIMVEATSKSENALSIEVPAVTDSVGIESVTNNAPQLFPVGETTVTWTATDISGNVQSVSQKITIIDTIPPKFAKIGPITVEATSNSENHVELAMPQVSDIQDITSITSDAPEFFPVGETTVTWTATDASGNSATATQKVTVVDTTAPTITAPADIMVEATSASDNTMDLGTAQASDLVLVDSVTSDAPELFPLGETTVTWTATDASGNSATATQKVTVVDTTAPTITAPADIVFEATAPSNTIELNMPAATDSVSEATLTSDAPELFPLGETTVTWTATDASGNSATATQKVTVVDTTAPDLVIPDNVVINAVSITTPVPIGAASVSDLTDEAPTVTNNAPQLFPLGQTIVTWTAEDKFGNTFTKSQTITVEACGKPDSAYNKIVGDEDDDILFGTTLADLIIGLGGDDIIYGDKGNDCILAGDGEDVVYGDEGNDYIHGGDGADIIKGQSGDDMLIGFTGTDIIDGGDDNDSCIVGENDSDIVIKCES